MNNPLSLLIIFWWIALVLWIGMAITVLQQFWHREVQKQNYPDFKPAYKEWGFILFATTLTILLVLGAIYLDLGLKKNNSDTNELSANSTSTKYDHIIKKTTATKT